MITAPPFESQLHTQSLEEFYEAAENYFPPQRQKYSGVSRTRSAPVPRVKSGKMAATGGRSGVKTAGTAGKSGSEKKPAGKAVNGLKSAKLVFSADMFCLLSHLLANLFN